MNIHYLNLQLQDSFRGCLINGFGVGDVLFGVALCSQITILPSAHKTQTFSPPICRTHPSTLNFFSPTKQKPRKPIIASKINNKFKPATRKKPDLWVTQSGRCWINGLSRKSKEGERERERRNESTGAQNRNQNRHRKSPNPRNYSSRKQNLHRFLTSNPRPCTTGNTSSTTIPRHPPPPSLKSN
jgi:hypothetical protein